MARLLAFAALLAAAVIQVQAGATWPFVLPLPPAAPSLDFVKPMAHIVLVDAIPCQVTPSTAADLCQSATYTFAPGNPTLVNATTYDGNSTAYDWTIDAGTPLNTNNNGGELALILTQDSRAPKGTRISTTEYVLYGTITATIKTSKWNGVVGAFITMSNIKVRFIVTGQARTKYFGKEIDWEWPGNHPLEAQSNFFFQGHVDYTAGHGATHTLSSDSYENYHDYTINWQPDQLQFSIDGNVVRTVRKEETLVDGVYQYPTSPARVQLSIWPGGLPDSPQGVVTWSGGLIQYNEPEYQAAGNQYQVLVSKVVIQCSTSSGLAVGPDTVSYMYGANDTSGIPTVYASNRTALLNDGSARYSLPFVGASAWSLIALAIGAGAALTF
ncbi:SubName: Full=Related to UTR2-cell wall protein {ECO:0000313/EMBL:CCA66555.1} [Serendipita indica DSM 11827]|nr:SubName: Full=Related to UTR2-cell wall protein {ECO:0000313/EMBL:CCA66555.1} [Serendipita indica DSM 11827]